MSDAEEPFGFPGAGVRAGNVGRTKSAPIPWPAADWGLWADMPRATLREAVLLSVGLEPRPARTTRIGYASPEWAEPGPEFHRRLTLACAYVGGDGPLRAVIFNQLFGTREAVEVSLPGFREWAEGMGWAMPEAFPGASARAPAAAQCPAADPVPARAPAVAAEGAPLPLTTGDIAFCFDGLRYSEARWKKPLGDKPKWLQACVAIPGRRGVSETRWNPVCIGAALEREGRASASSVRARFQTRPMLLPWLDAWKTYEADYIESA